MYTVSPIKTTSTKTEKTDNNLTTSTTIKSAYRKRRPISTAIFCGTENTPPWVVWKSTSGFTRMCINRLDCKTSIMMKKPGCTTTWCVITSLRRVGLWIKFRLDWWVGKFYISLHWTNKDGTTLKAWLSKDRCNRKK